MEKGPKAFRGRSVAASIALLAVLSVALPVACASTPSRAQLRQRIAETPAKNLSSYRFDPAVPLVERVQTAPDMVLQQLRSFDKTDTYFAYTPTAEEMKLVAKNLGLLPPRYKEILQKRLVGLYFVSNLIGSGLTDYVLDDHDNVYATLALNPEVLKHNISDWVTLRERSCFTENGKEDGGIQVTVECGTEYSGLTYILLHESGHIADYVEHYTPYVDGSMQVLGIGVGPTPFTTPVWRSYGRPKSEYDFPLRQDIHFYGLGSRIDASRAVDLYRSLARSPFASLYGAQNWAEDFAEYTTWYYFTQVLRQPYRIEVFKRGDLVYSLEPMKSERVLARWGAVAPLFERSAGLPISP